MSCSGDVTCVRKQGGGGVWLAGELGRNLMTHSWHCFVLVGGVILNVIDGGHGPRSTDPGRKIALRAVLEGFPEAVFLFDVHSCIIELNKAAERLSGQSRDELLGMRAGALFSRVLGAEADVNPEAIVSRTLRGELVRHERRVLHNAIGGLIDVRISGSPMYYSAKRILGALVVIADVTELSALRQQIASSKRHFVVGQMTAGLAHDFNNVLGTISQAVYVLETAADRFEPDRTMLGIINNAVRRGAEIVNIIREYLRGSNQVRIRVAFAGCSRKCCNWRSRCWRCTPTSRSRTRSRDACRGLRQPSRASSRVHQPGP